jgi:hypothetical protein
MAIARNCNNDRVSQGSLSTDDIANTLGNVANTLDAAGNLVDAAGNLVGAVGRLPTDTAKQNYTAIRYGNDHGSISFGGIHKQGDVTAGVMLQTSDANHSFFMDKDGPRKGWTTLTSPGNVQIEAGSNNEEAQDTLMINAKNGNILIVASNGKIRLEGTDIELIATGEGGSKGNIRMFASENIETNSKKLLMNSKVAYKIVSSGSGEVVANSILKMYGSIFKGVDDSCSVKDAKNGGKNVVDKNNKVS